MSTALFDELIELQVRRKHYIRSCVSLENRARGLILRALGWHSGLSKPESDKPKKTAQMILARALAGKPLGEFDWLAPDLEVTRQQREPGLQARAEVEKRMRQLARQLPVWSAFAADVRGLGDLGLAVIVGECGDLSNYATAAKVWRRLGLAPFKGRAGSTWRRTGGLTAEEWTEFGYAPQRRGQIYGVVTAPLFQCQRAGMRYRDKYLARRARTAITHPDWSKAHSDNDARRIMTKDLIEDLWSSWTGASASMPHASHEMRRSASRDERRVDA